MIKRVLAGGAAYYFTFESETAAAFVETFTGSPVEYAGLGIMLFCAASIVMDLWAGDVPAIGLVDRVQRAVIERLSESEEERIVRAISSRPTGISPDRLINEVLNDDDREWLLEQVRMTTKEFNG